jgi:hypothetical protein
LTGQNAVERFLEAFVYPGKVTDFASADADVAGRDVGVFAGVALELDPERQAEPSDFPGWIAI